MLAQEVEMLDFDASRMCDGESSIKVGEGTEKSGVKLPRHGLRGEKPQI